MKSMIAIITLSTGVLLGCQDKATEQIKESSSMEQNQKSEASHADHGHASMEKAVSPEYYTCPMESHKHINSQEAGNCPECGMALIPVVETTAAEADFYGCPMPEHSHVRAEEAGSCPECGMQLKPMKLGS